MQPTASDASARFPCEAFVGEPMRDRHVRIKALYNEIQENAHGPDWEIQATELRRARMLASAGAMPQSEQQVAPLTEQSLLQVAEQEPAGRYATHALQNPPAEGYNIWTLQQGVISAEQPFFPTNREHARSSSQDARSSAGLG